MSTTTMARSPHSLALAAAMAIGVTGSGAVAQCTVELQPMGEISGVFGTAGVVAPYDPDGPGPRSQVLVFGGSFSVAGDVSARNIAAWDPATTRWSALGSGLDNAPTAIAQLPDGRLAVGGQFQNAGGLPASRIAIWDGTTWSNLGGGLDLHPVCLLALPNGDLVAAGQFVNPSYLVARWNGTTWSSLGSGLGPGQGGISGPFVTSLALMPNGDLVASGRFSLAGQSTALSLARWNGTSWQPLVPNSSGDILEIAVDAQGDLLASGTFDSLAGVPAHRIARFDGTNWHAFGIGLSRPVSFLHSPSGALRVAGFGIESGQTILGATAEWNGSSWQSLAPDPQVGFWINSAVEMPSGDLIAVGPFMTNAELPSKSILRWNGSTWGPLHPPRGPMPFLLGAVHDCVAMPNGDRIFVGNMVDHVIRFDGVVATPLGSAIRGNVRAAVPIDDTQFVVGGEFTLTTANGLTYNVARWNGTEWVAMQSSANSISVNAIVRLGDSLFFGGRFGSQSSCVRWSEASGWQDTGLNGTGEVFDLATTPDGDVVAAGSISLNQTYPGTDNVVRYRAGSWTRLGDGLVKVGPFGTGGTVRSLDFLPTGELIAGGQFNLSGSLSQMGLAKWNGVDWRPFTSHPVSEVLGAAVLPDGTPVITSGYGDVRVWNGANWDLLGPARTLIDVTDIHFALDPDGSLYVGGQFARIGNMVSDHLAKLVSTCAAGGARLASGCTAANDSLQVEIVRLAWLGGRLATRCHGVGPNSIALWHIGTTSPGFLLSDAAPTGTAGCRHLASFDLCSKIATPDANGVLGGTENVPNDAALLGLHFFHQYTILEFATDGSLTGITSSDAHEMTVGSF